MANPRPKNQQPKAENKRSLPLKNRLLILCVALVQLQFFTGFTLVFGGEKTIILQSTTSTQNSGLFDAILPVFETDTGIRVNVVAVGTGQALKNGRNGDGDVVLVHAKKAEERFVASGYGIKRFDLMYNDFVLIGPSNDPAEIFGLQSIVAAMKTLSETKSIFVSRGDDSGTNRKELELWKNAKIGSNNLESKWYRETGSGMGATLNIAAGIGAYTLSDRATWMAFENKHNLKIMSEGDPLLFNQYGIILVNPALHPHIKTSLANRFIQWMIGEKGQAAIAAFKLAGKQLFFPNAQYSGG